jgi:hypothetical protein
VANLHETHFVAADTNSLHHAVDTIPRHAEDGVNTPGDEALDENIGTCIAHGSVTPTMDLQRSAKIYFPHRHPNFISAIAAYSKLDSCKSLLRLTSQPMLYSWNFAFARLNPTRGTVQSLHRRSVHHRDTHMDRVWQLSRTHSQANPGRTNPHICGDSDWSASCAGTPEPAHQSRGIARSFGPPCVSESLEFSDFSFCFSNPHCPQMSWSAESATPSPSDIAPPVRNQFSLHTLNLTPSGESDG